MLLGSAAATAVQPGTAQPSPPLTVITPEGRRPLPAVMVGSALMVGLDDLAPLFQLTLHEDSMTGGMVVGYAGKSVLLTAGQALASAGGRLVSLPAPVVHEGARWLVPVEFISRALGPLSSTRLDVRRNARLVIVGDVRVPRVLVREETTGPQRRVTLEVSPRTPHTISQDGNRLLVRFDADALDATVPRVSADPVLQGIRVGDQGAALTLELGPRFGAYRAATASGEAASGQIIVDLLPAGPAAPEAAQPSEPPGAPPAGAAPPLPGPALGQPSRFAPLRTIVIDAGHGGADAGVRGTGRHRGEGRDAGASRAA